MALPRPWSSRYFQIIQELNKDIKVLLVEQNENVALTVADHSLRRVLETCRIFIRQNPKLREAYLGEI